MVEPTKDRYALDAADELRWPEDRLPLGERLVWASLIVEIDERGDEGPEVLLVEDKDAVEELASQRANQPFGESIHFGRMDRGAYDLRADGGEDRGEPCRGEELVRNHAAALRTYR